MDVFDAEKKPGYAVGLQLVVLDPKGVKISDHENEWYGFDRNGANTMAMGIANAVEAVINKFREEQEGGTPGPRKR